MGEKKAVVSAQDVADYFLSSVDAEHGDNISNLKLQKLLYYAQGFHLAMTDGEPLFGEEIVAWQYGPVVPELYRKYKHHGAGAIPAPESYGPGEIPGEGAKIVEEVYRIYGQYSATRLMQMTHEEPPWRNTSINEPISFEEMRAYFATQLEG